MSQNFQKTKLRLREVINAQPRLNDFFIGNKLQYLEKYQNKKKNVVLDTITLQVKMFKTNTKIFNQIVKFLEKSFVEIYKVDYTTSNTKVSNKLIFKRELEKGAIICLFDPHKDVFEIPLKIDKILLYGNPSKNGYIIKVRNTTKYEYIIEEYSII